MKKYLGYLVVFLLFFSACSTTPWMDQLLYRPGDYSETTQLQVRELQQRTYDTSDKNRVLKAMLNVLQDDGYMIKNLDAGLGYFNAIKEKTRNSKYNTPLKDIFEVTVGVSEFGDKTKVRVSFYYKCISMPYANVGVTTPETELGSTEIFDPQFYQDFFNKVDKAIFIEKQKL